MPRRPTRQFPWAEHRWLLLTSILALADPTIAQVRPNVLAQSELVALLASGTGAFRLHRLIDTGTSTACYFWSDARTPPSCVRVSGEKVTMHWPSPPAPLATLPVGVVNGGAAARLHRYTDPDLGVTCYLFTDGRSSPSCVSDR